MSDRSFAKRITAGALLLLMVSGCDALPQASPTSSAGPTSTPAFVPETPEPTPTPTTPSPSPAAAPIPAAAMLLGTDIGRGFTTNDDRRLVHNDHSRLGMLLAYCGQYDFGPAYQVDRTRGAISGERFVYQQVERYGRGDGARYLAGLRRVLPKCATYLYMHDPQAEGHLTVVANRFAGDDALLIRHELRAHEVEYHAVVRQGDVVMTVRVHIGAAESRARSIVQRLAGRLCAATPTC